MIISPVFSKRWIPRNEVSPALATAPRRPAARRPASIVEGEDKRLPSLVVRWVRKRAILQFIENTSVRLAAHFRDLHTSRIQSVAEIIVRCPSRLLFRRRATRADLAQPRGVVDRRHRKLRQQELCPTPWTVHSRTSSFANDGARELPNSPGSTGRGVDADL